MTPPNAGRIPEAIVVRRDCQPPESLDELETIAGNPPDQPQASQMARPRTQKAADLTGDDRKLRQGLTAARAAHP
ncbi:hypothetical protein [Rhodopseudomonas pseudopalustris]|uniref:Uncharacterized protein n=1 Tax=Rhodopseudomonas pseudopalustris TaxID=1513892 RepID=A0A1H8U6M7_9BRAD|nr:hypothetical protein [Rhodopseudomonas pseudopalustris]MBB1089902.1 hypothetical protein [Rhodopseudomonas palustris]SEO98831.1 hypothetical protein SAMN05444123_106320 [Rhodopseudomonas pseudopalustris]